MSLIDLSAIGQKGLCKCVGKHVPLPTVVHKHHILPIYLGGGNDPSNFIYLCPTTHDNVHSLLRQYAKSNGRPPGAVCKHYSAFVEVLAARAWAEAKAAGVDRQTILNYKEPNKIALDDSDEV